MIELGLGLNVAEWISPSELEAEMLSESLQLCMTYRFLSWPAKMPVRCEVSRLEKSVIPV